MEENTKKMLAGLPYRPDTEELSRISTKAHRLSRDYNQTADEDYGAPITIGDNCWLASNVTVCPGVTIGKNCVIGAGSVVTKNIPDNSLVLGVPGRVVRKITEKDRLDNYPY